MPLSAGARLGPYEILGQIGAGGMGEIYRARDPRLGREVAIKVLHAEWAKDPDRLKRFEREARAAGSLNHPNVVVIHDVGIDAGVSFVVSELLEGQTLGSRLGGGRLDRERVLDWALQMARGLAAAHAKGIIHRDLKPENVFLTDDGRVKILDFGLAKLVAPSRLGRDEPTASNLTQPGKLMGTLPYMSPEQVRGFAVDPRSDIFSFGVVLYEMLTGRHPFRRGTLEATLSAILLESPREPAAADASIPPALDWLVRRCLEKRREDRFSSASSLVAALEAVKESREMPPPAYSRSGHPATGSADTSLLTRVAVAVFENRTREPSLDSLGLMVADWITHGLGQIQGLSVALAPSSAMGVAGAGDRETAVQRSDPRRLAEATHAGLVVSGACYLLGSELQIHASLSDPARDRLLLTLEPVAGPRAEAGELVDRTRRAAVSAVAAHLDRDYDVTAMPVPCLEAYQAFHLAKDSWYLDWDAVILHLHRALTLDPGFSLLRTWLAMAYSFVNRHAEAEQQLAEVERSGRRLSPFEQAEVRRVQAHVRGRLEETLAAAREMERLAPEVAWVRYNRACYASLTNRQAEAVAAFSALGGDSHWGGQWAALDLRAHACHALRLYEDQLEVARRGTERHPGFLYFLEHEAAALSALHPFDDLERVVGRALTLQAKSGTAGLVMLVGAMELRAHGQHGRSVDLARRAADWYGHQSEDIVAMLQTPNRGIEWYLSRPPDIGRRLQEERGAALYWAECWEGAESIFAGLTREDPTHVEYRGQLGAMAARRGDLDEARRVDEALRTAAGPRLLGEHTFWRACIAAQLGDRQKTVDLLREAVSQGRYVSTHIHRHIDLQAVWDYAPFRELIAPAAAENLYEGIASSNDGARDTPA